MDGTAACEVAYFLISLMRGRHSVDALEAAGFVILSSDVSTWVL